MGIHNDPVQVQSYLQFSINFRHTLYKPPNVQQFPTIKKQFSKLKIQYFALILIT